MTAIPHPQLHRRGLLAAGLALASLAAPPAWAAPTVGAAAPGFQIADAEGRTRSLAEFKGKVVVLEWANSECPYTRKHYDSQNMQRLQAEAAKEGDVWLTVVTGPPGSQSYMTPAQASAWKRKEGSHATAILLDPDARLARAYQAKTTPHIFIVDKAGRLVYMGGIDDRPYADPASLKGATNYVALALADLQAGRPIAHPVTRPYGCSVKYPPAA